MALKSLGIVTNASTTVAVKASSTYTTAHPTVVNFPTESVQFQALGTNTGVVYICDTANPNLTTGLGVLVEIPAPSSSAATGTRPAWQADVPTAAASIDANAVYILPTVSGEGVRVSIARP